MEIQRIFFILGFCLLVSGKPANEVFNDDYCDPLVVTLGDYYSPKVKCNIGEERIRAKQIQLLQKYMLELGIDETNKNREPIVQELKNLIDAGTRNFEPPSLTCTACSSAVNLFKLLVSGNSTTDDILNVGVALCTDLNVMYAKMCRGIVQVYGESFIDIIKRTPYDSRTFCSILLNGVCYLDAANKIKWDVAIPPNKPPVLKLKENPGKPKLKVLHLSDTHWDAEYEEGTSAECRSILCCRNNSVPIPGHQEISGKYGGWKCDLPEATFDSLIQHIKEQHKDIDYIIWTGDIPAHDLWSQNESSNYDILKRTLEKLEKAFPNTPVYPALGNHESVPPNLYPTKNDLPNDPLSWLYQKLNKEWHFWLPGNNSETILRGGFYSVLAKPKLRIISMNMNYCYTMNWWLLVNGVDPEKELQWLVSELRKAEENGEKVHIIGHVPSGYHECVKAWQTNFYKIVNRFENTVTAQFFGHTHTDEFEIFYDMKDNSRPFGIGYVGPSVTTYTYMNPGYRVYYVDGDYEGTTRYVLDHETWIMNLKTSNEKRAALWEKLYTAKEGYNMTSLFPEDWHKVYESMKKSNEVMDLYLKYYWKDSPKRPDCDANCRMKLLCDIRSCVQYVRVFDTNIIENRRREVNRQ
ncbi:UNVERIFIED_CONTAM: hypothetical protein PYX00_009859 [Menopon gallinae]|uniref:Sphingomyelin phosphodiesterase n=1 Tax=Menopon gallinae TaxID=328185 RepID=A0AAW2HDK8_9NEOP